MTRPLLTPVLIILTALLLAAMTACGGNTAPAKSNQRANPKQIPGRRRRPHRRKPPQPQPTNFHPYQPQRRKPPTNLHPYRPQRLSAHQEKNQPARKNPPSPIRPYARTPTPSRTARNHRPQSPWPPPKPPTLDQEADPPTTGNTTQEENP